MHAALSALIDRSAELKCLLVDFAQSPRFDTALTAAFLEAERTEIELDEAGAIEVIDRFIHGYHFPDGTTVVDHFVAGCQELTGAERETVLGWRDPVEGIFEIQGRDDGALVLLNLIDDLEYRTYANVGPAVFRGMRKGAFLVARLLPLGAGTHSWLISGVMTPHPGSAAPHLADTALRIAAHHPGLVFRNPAKIEQGWEHMRQDRERFIEFFGADQIVLPSAQATERLNAYYRRRQVDEPAPAQSAPADEHPLALDDSQERFADCETVGIIYDRTDGLNLYADYGLLIDLFAAPARAPKKQFDLLRSYLTDPEITPLPIRRLAAAHPDTVDNVMRKLLRRPAFRWDADGEALLRLRKPWYFTAEPRPGVSVIGTRLAALLRSGGR